MDGCPHCLTAQLALKKYGVTYEKLNWSLDSNDAIFEELGISKVPVLLFPSEDGSKRLEGEDAIKDYAMKLKEGLI